jgi:hypothetical protein
VRNMRRWVATAAMVLAVLGAAMAPARADPTKAPNVQPFPIICDGTTFTVVVVPGQGGWTPALVTSGTAVLVPFRLELTITSLTTGESVTSTVSKQAAEVTTTTTCRFEQTFTNPQTGETHQVVGVLEVLRQPSASSG